MGKAIKGCMNEACEAHKKKVNFIAKYEFCPRCGQELSFVCKECRMKLESDSKKYCVRCESMRKDAREQIAKTVADKIGRGASAAATAVAGVAVDVGGKTKDVAGNIVVTIKEHKVAENSEDAAADGDKEI